VINGKEAKLSRAVFSSIRCSQKSKRGTVQFQSGENSDRKFPQSDAFKPQYICQHVMY
jgi:hypothetical protein